MGSTGKPEKAIQPVLEAIVRSVSPDDLLRATVDGIVHLFGFEHVGIYLHDGACSGLLLAARNSRYVEDLPLGLRLPYARGAVARALSQRRRQVVLSPELHPDLPWVPAATRAQAAVPMVAAGECLGVIDLQSPRREAFPRSALDAVSRIARMSAVGLYHAYRGRQQAGRARLLQAVFDASAAGVLMVGRDGRIVFASRRVAELLALPGESGGSLAGQSFDETFWQLLNSVVKRPPAWGPDEVRAVVSRGEELEEDIELRTPQRRVLRRWCGPVRDDDGGLAGWVELYEDVTSERMAARRLEVAAEIARATSSGRDIPSVFAALAAGLSKIIGFDRVMACISHEPSQVTLVQVCAEGCSVSVSPKNASDAHRATGATCPPCPPQTAPYIAGDLQAGEHTCMVSSRLAADGMEQACLLPLKADDRHIGLLAIATASKLPAYTPDDLALLAPSAEFIALAVRNSLLREKLLASSKEAADRAALLAGVNRASRRLSSSLELDGILREVADSVTTDLKVGSVGIYLPGEPGGGFSLRLGRGPLYEATPPGSAGPVAGPATVAAAAQGRQVHEGGWLALPASFGGKVLGVLCLSSAEGDPFAEFDILGFETVADHLAVALNNAGHYRQARDLHLAIAHSLAVAVETRDPYARGHSSKVAEYALLIAGRLGLSRDETEDLRLAAMLHDIGKVGVEDSVLTKRGPLDPVERALVMEHPTAGASILKVTPALAGLAPSVRSHHEWYGGGGYPDGISGDAIPRNARILAVADAFDAMTSDRPYRTALRVEEALKRLLEGAGTQFDPAIVRAFREAVSIGRSAGDSIWLGHEQRIALEQQAGAPPGPVAREDFEGRILPVHGKALSVMYRVSLETGSILQREQLLGRILAILHDAVGKHKYVLLLFAPGSRDLVVEAETGFGPAIHGLRIPSGRGLTSWVAEHGTPLVVKDVERDPRYFPVPEIRIRSELAAPLVARGQVIGVLDIESELPSAFTTEDLYLITAVAGQISIAIDAAQQHEEVARAAIIDGLTGLLNHSHFYERLSEELARSRRYGRPMVVGLADVDGMKAVNDLYGHVCGDAALRAVASCLRNGLRATDLVARYGGDEFAVIMPEATVSQALAAAARVAAVMADTRVGSGPVEFDVPRVSFGFASYPDDATTVSALVCRADERLYAEKRSKGLQPQPLLPAVRAKTAGR